MNKLLAVAFLMIATAIAITSTTTHSQPAKNLAFINKFSQKEGQEFLVGMWRGYREAENFIMYYGYEFRSNGTFLARHRVYQNEVTILDEFWQGQWQLEKELLFLEGVSTTNNQRTVRIRFRLADDGQLYYEGGTLPKPYIPLQLGRQTRSP